jgi:hypothetical protein
VAEQEGTGDLAARTVSGYGSAVRLHINPILGRRTVGDLDQRIVANWLGSLRKKGLADRTVLRIFRTAHRAFGDASLDRNPFDLPKRMRPKVRHEKPTYRPPLDEVITFLGHVSHCGQSSFLSVPPGLDWLDQVLERRPDGKVWVKCYCGELVRYDMNRWPFGKFRFPWADEG